MESLRQRLSSKTFAELLGVMSMSGWRLRPGESPLDREKLLEFLNFPSAERELLDFLRDQKVPRQLANCLLETAKIPTTIPAGAMNVLGLGEDKSTGSWPEGHHVEDGSPLDWPVFWDNPGSGRWFWRRNDWSIVAVPLDGGGWERQLATY